MAHWYEPTDEQRALCANWTASLPEAARVVAMRFNPWTLYRMKDTGHRVTLYSFSEDGTVTVNVLGQFNAVAMERRVFGVDPDDLTECDLPAEGEPLGVLLNKAEQLKMVNERRAANGIAPLTELP